MKIPKIISVGANYKAIDIGSFDKIPEYEFIHPKFGNIDKSRLFVGEILQTTGAEISFRELQPKTKIPFLHKHKSNEEIYIFFKGSGQFQVDDVAFNIKEGSIVKVSLDGSRTLSNDSGEPMLYMVVQAKEGTLKDYNVIDGYRVEGKIKL